MDLAGRAKRVRVYVKESDVIGRKLAPLAILEFLQRERAAGAIVLRGTAGFGSSGHIDDDAMPELAPHLPVIVEWVDAPDRVQRLMPRLQELVGRGLITVEDVEIAMYRPEGVRDLPATVTAAEVMSREVTSVGPDAPLLEVVKQVDGKVYRAVPVVEDGKPVGIITNQDLTGRGGLLARVELLAALPPEERASALAEVSGKKARDVMTPQPVTVRSDAPLSSVGALMTERRLKRLPVVDAGGKLVGMISRLDLLRQVAGASGGASEQRPLGLRGDVPLATVMRRDVPRVAHETPLGEVLQTIVSTPVQRALVVDASGKLLGVVGDEELLDRVTPGLRRGALRSLMRRLPFTHSSSPAEQHSRATRAADLMTPVATAREDQSLRDAIAPMMKAPHKLVAVVDASGKLVGAVDRVDILRGLVS
jgi:CBS domain-containing protein